MVPVASVNFRPRVNASVCGPRSVTPVDVRSCQCQCLRVAVSERGWARTEEPGGDAMTRTVMYIYIMCAQLPVHACR